MARPAFFVSFATSLDGIIGRNGPLALSSQKSLLLTHALRSQFEGILIGAGTLATDNPRLNCRLDELAKHAGYGAELAASGSVVRQPVPIVLDSSLSIDLNAKLLEASEARLPIIVWDPELAPRAPEKKQKLAELQARSCRCLAIPGYAAVPQAQRWNLLGQALEELGVGSVFVEGGGGVLSSLLSTKLWTRSVICMAPRLFGSGVRWYTADSDRQLRLLGNWNIDGDLILEAVPAQSDLDMGSELLVPRLLGSFGLAGILT